MLTSVKIYLLLDIHVNYRTEGLFLGVWFKKTTKRRRQKTQDFS